MSAGSPPPWRSAGPRPCPTHEWLGDGPRWPVPPMLSTPPDLASPTPLGRPVPQPRKTVTSTRITPDQESSTDYADLIKTLDLPAKVRLLTGGDVFTLAPEPSIGLR